jgi:hypothetical protein
MPPLLIVSDDWFARAVIALAAEHTERFSRVITADDGYTALAHTWQIVEEGGPLPVYVIDRRSVGVSASRLIIELRNDETTQHAFIAVVAPGESVVMPGMDFATDAALTNEGMIGALHEIAILAQAGVSVRRGGA